MTSKRSGRLRLPVVTMYSSSERLRVPMMAMYSTCEHACDIQKKWLSILHEKQDCVEYALFLKMFGRSTLTADDYVFFIEALEQFTSAGSNFILTRGIP